MKKIRLTTFFILLLTACSNATPAASTATFAELPAATETIAAVPTETPTATLEPSATPLPTETPTPEPTPFGGSGGKIAFEVNQRDLQDLYLIDAQATALEQLVLGQAGDRAFFGQWSPDGSQILYRHFNNPLNELWVIAADGSNPQQITESFDFGNDWINPIGQWSPDGQFIYVVVKHGKANFDEYRRYNLMDGSFTPMAFFPVAWSPDGSQAVGYAAIDGDQEIYSMDADGSNSRNLTNNPAKDELFNLYGSPWSPDGEQILFSSDRDGLAQIYIMDADGANVRNLSQATGRVRSWAWSPDGQWVYYASDQGGNYNLWRVDINGENKTQITEMAGHEVRYFISPDSSTIIIQNNRGGQNYPYRIDADGANAAHLLNDPTLPGQIFGWSSDGKWILAIMTVDNQDSVYLIAADGSEIRPLTPGLFEGNPILNNAAWMP